MSARATDPPAGGVTHAVALALATGGGVGLLPRAPGTFGSAIPALTFAIFSPIPVWTAVMAWVGLLPLSIWSAGRAGRIFGVEDDPRIVIDEILGQLTALMPVLILGAAPGAIYAVLAAFILFRAFDIFKPGPVAWLERNTRGGLGVVLDDLAAGILAAALLLAPISLGAFGESR